MAVASHFWKPSSLATPSSKPPPLPQEQTLLHQHYPLFPHNSTLSEKTLYEKTSYPLSALPQPPLSTVTTETRPLASHPFYAPCPKVQRAIVTNPLNSIPQDRKPLNSLNIHPGVTPPPHVPKVNQAFQAQHSAEAAIAEFSSIVTFYLLQGNLQFPDVSSRLSAAEQQRSYNEGGIQSLYFYCLDVLKISKLSSPIVLLCLKYIDRLVGLDPKRSTGITDSSRPGAAVTLFAVCLMLASKMLDDNCYDTRTWSTIVKLPIRELIKWESCALGALRFDVNVSGTEYSQWLQTIDHLAIRIDEMKEKMLREEREGRRRSKAAEMQGLGRMREQADAYRRFLMEDHYRTMLVTAETYGREFNPRILNAPSFAGSLPFASPVSSTPLYCPVYTANSYPSVQANPTTGVAVLPLKYPNPGRYHTQEPRMSHFFAMSKETHKESGCPPPLPLYDHHQSQNHHPGYSMT